jgi:uncharacterized protein (UPF0335 family)
MADALANGFDPEVVSRFVSRLESLHSDLASEKGEYMQRCRQIRDEIKDVLQAAKDEDGIPKKALKTLIKKRELLGKIENLADFLEVDDRSAFEALEQALGDYGDTPLGQAAKMAARMDDDAARKGPRRKQSEPEAEAATAV